MKTPRNSSDIHTPMAAYSHQIEVSEAERWLVLSGQVGMHPDGSVPEDAIQQLEVALENVLRNLAAANMEVKDLLKLTLYLVGDWDTARRKDVIAARLEGHQPCMTLIYVAGLAAPIYRVEIDAWASREE